MIIELELDEEEIGRLHRAIKKTLRVIWEISFDHISTLPIDEPTKVLLFRQVSHQLILHYITELLTAFKFVDEESLKRFEEDGRFSNC